MKVPSSGGAPKSAQRKQKDKEHFTEQEALQQQCYPKYPSRSPLPKSEAVTVGVAAARKQASHPLQRAATPQLKGTVGTVLPTPTEPPAKAIAAHCSTKQPGPKRVPEDVPGSNKKQKREEASQSTDGKGTSSHPPLMSIGKRYLVETKKKIGEGGCQGVLFLPDSDRAQNYRNITSPFDVKEDVKAYEVPRDASPVPQKKEPPVHSGKAKKQQWQPLQAAGRVKEAAAPVAVEIQNIKKMQEQQNLKLAKLIERKSVEILHDEEGISMQQQKLKEKKRDLTELIHCTAPPTPVPDDRGASSSISAAPGEMSQTIQLEDSDYDYSYSDSGEAPPAAAPDNARSMTASAKAQAVSASDSEEGSSCEDSEGSESEEDTSG